MFFFKKDTFGAKQPWGFLCFAPRNDTN